MTYEYFIYTPRVVFWINQIAIYSHLSLDFKPTSVITMIVQYYCVKYVFDNISGRLLLFARCQDRVHLHDDTPKLSPPEWLYIKTTSCDAYTIRTAITSHLSWLKKNIILNRIF